MSSLLNIANHYKHWPSQRDILNYFTVQGTYRIKEELILGKLLTPLGWNVYSGLIVLCLSTKFMEAHRRPDNELASNFHFSSIATVPGRNHACTSAPGAASITGYPHCSYRHRPPVRLMWSSWSSYLRINSPRALGNRRVWLTKI